MWRKLPDADSAFRNTCDAAALGSGAGCHDAAAAEVGPCGPVVLRIKTWGNYTKRNRLGIFMIFDGDNNNEWQWWFKVSTSRVAPTNCGIIKATLGGAGEVYIFICCFCSHLECGFYTKNMSFWRGKWGGRIGLQSYTASIVQPEISTHFNIFQLSTITNINVHPLTQPKTRN